jgi:hypothetical protein
MVRRVITEEEFFAALAEICMSEERRAPMVARDTLTGAMSQFFIARTPPAWFVPEGENNDRKGSRGSDAHLPRV